MAGWLARKVTRSYQWLSMLVTRRFAPSFSIYGIRFIDATMLGGESGAESQARAALQLIVETDPRRFDRLRRYMDEVVIVPIDGAEYSFDLEICFLGTHQLEHGDAVSTASILVHESIHAYLHHKGCRWTPDRHGRIERAAIREELRFAARLGDPLYVSRAKRKLENIPKRTSELAQREEEIAALDLPQWLRRIWRSANTP